MPKAGSSERSGLWYQEWGSRRAPTVLALHGFTGSHRTWEMLARCAGPGLRIVAPDLPGHGRTGGTDPERMTMARTAAALLELPLPQAFHVMGYSMGARVALYLALTAPERVLSLVLESGSPGLAEAHEREARRTADERWVRLLTEKGLSSFAALWAAQPLFSSQQDLPLAVRRSIQRERLRQDPAGLAASLRGAGTGVQESLWEELGQLSIPLLIVAGARDPKFVGIGRAMALRVPTARLVILPGCGHAPHLEVPTSFVKLVTEFWSGLAEAPRLPSPRGTAG